MITIKKVNILKNWGTRIGRESNKRFYNVSVTEKYDLVQFVIAELNLDVYWHTSIGVPLNTSEEEINNYINKYIKGITKSDINNYRDFINEINKYGAD